MPYLVGMQVTDKLSFAEKLIKAAGGASDIVEPTYVYLPGVPGGDAVAKEVGVDYFSVPVLLGVSRSHRHTNFKKWKSTNTIHRNPAPKRPRTYWEEPTTMRRS